MSFQNMSTAQLLEEKEKLERLVRRYDLNQKARKIAINAAYGSVGSPYFRFFDVRAAEAITLSGQLTIRWIEKALNQYLNKIMSTEDVDYVIASDTDSVYLNLSEFVRKAYKTIPEDKQVIVDFLDKAMKQAVLPFIDRQYAELGEYVNAYEQTMKMGREVIADRGIWCNHPDNVVIVDGVPVTFGELYASQNGQLNVDFETLSFNMITKEWEKDIAELLVVHDWDGDIYCLELENGKELRLTGDHCVFVERNGEIIEEKVSNLQENDELKSIQ